MQLNYRIGQKQDFTAFYENCYYPHRKNVELRRVMKHEWDTFTSNSTTLTLVIDDSLAPEETRLVGCGQVVFVSDAFARHAREQAIPWVNLQAANPLPDGSWPNLDADQARSANSGDGLNALITRWDSAELLPLNDGLRVRELMMRIFNTYSRGYNYKEVLFQVIGHDALLKSLNMGFRLRCDYVEFYLCNPPAPPPDKHPYLLGLHRSEVAAAEGSIAGYLFVYTPPRFYFSPGEQHLLAQALDGKSDQEVTEIMGCSLAGVKAIWQRVFTRVQNTDPEFLPESRSSTRGLEKRRLLLPYLHIHPEELRPIKVPSEKSGKR